LRRFDQVGVMAARDIGMRTQAALEVIAADIAKERIERILREAA
jgi:hypothetical protein